MIFFVKRMAFDNPCGFVLHFHPTPGPRWIPLMLQKYRVLYISGGCLGFLLSTVPSEVQVSWMACFGGLLGIGIDHWKRLARDDWLKKLGEGPNFRLPKFRTVTFHNFIMGAKMKHRNVSPWYHTIQKKITFLKPTSKSSRNNRKG